MRLIHLTEDFNYDILADEKWRELLKEAMDDAGINFDTENDDAKHKNERIIKVGTDLAGSTSPRKYAKFRCQIRAAGGDWQQMSYYFRCQIIDGWAHDFRFDREMSTYTNNMFCMIPPKDGGNVHLLEKDGRMFPPDQHDKEEMVPNAAACWEWLTKQLTKMVHED